MHSSNLASLKNSNIAVHPPASRLEVGPAKRVNRVGVAAPGLLRRAQVVHGLDPRRHGRQVLGGDGGGAVGLGKGVRRLAVGRLVRVVAHLVLGARIHGPHKIVGAPVEHGGGGGGGLGGLVDSRLDLVDAIERP